MKLLTALEVVILLAVFVFTATWNIPSDEQLKRALDYYEAHPEAR